MEAVFSPVSPAQEQRANRLRLVQFYVPRLLAAPFPDPPGWVYARAMQHLGEAVLLPYLPAAEEPVFADLLLSWRALRRLGQCLRAQRLAPPPYWQQEVDNWQKVQGFLMRAMPLVERMLAPAAGAAASGETS